MGYKYLKSEMFDGYKITFEKRTDVYEKKSFVTFYVIGKETNGRNITDGRTYKTKEEAYNHAKNKIFELINERRREDYPEEY